MSLPINVIYSFLRHQLPENPLIFFVPILSEYNKIDLLCIFACILLRTKLLPLINASRRSRYYTL